MTHEKMYYESYQCYFFLIMSWNSYTRPHTLVRVVHFFFFLLFIRFCSHWRLAKHIYEHRYIHVHHPYTKWISPAVASTRRVANRNMFIVHSVEQKKKQQKNDFIFFVILFVYCFRILIVHISIYRLSHSPSMLHFCISSNSILHPFQCIGLHYYITLFYFILFGLNFSINWSDQRHFVRLFVICVRCVSVWAWVCMWRAINFSVGDV